MKFFFKILSITAFILIFSLMIAFAQSEIPEDQGVYEYVLNCKQPTVQVVNLLEQKIAASPWKLVGKRTNGSPNDCEYKATVLILYDSSYAAQLMQINPLTAPFAIMDRINVFDDEAGVHISIVNPNNINRTILMDDEKYNSLSNNHRLSLRKFIADAVHGEATNKQYGEIRDEGYIGKTMGVMAGGPFNKKLEDIFKLKDKNLADVFEKVSNGLAQPGPEWDMHLIYKLYFPENNFALIGLSGNRMEAKSFDIVSEGSDDDREDFKCPGIAHASAYPIELVLVQEGTQVSVRMVDAMFRMKMYFEDAGMFAFAKNMGMPGSLKDEIVTMLQKVFPTP